MPNLNIRDAEVADTALILHFIRELASYEKAEHEVLATEEHIQRNIFCDNPHVFALICELDGEAIGFAIYFYSYSTWLGKPSLFLEDLYVSQQHRGVGGGVALLRQLARIALARDCGRFEWNVLDWNEPAIKFYDSLGALPQKEWIGYRLSGQALQDFAGSTP